jgi:hypothetical protein
VEHPGMRTPEMMAIWHKGYENVAADREGVTKVYTSPEVKELIRLRSINLLSYKDAAGHSEKVTSGKPVRQKQDGMQKNYSRYTDIFDLIRNEFTTLRVNGTSVYNTRINSFTLSSEVLYVLNDMIISDISIVSPAEVERVEFLDDYRASEYGMRGANGILKITLKTK